MFTPDSKPFTCPKSAELRGILLGGVLVKTAVLVDGAFFIIKARRIYGMLTPRSLVSKLLRAVRRHMRGKNNDWHSDLYRIFFYDCPPLDKKMEHPLTQKQIDYGKSTRATWRRELHNVLRTSPRTALRLGVVDDVNCSWVIDSDKLKKLCKGKIHLTDLAENDITLNSKQKGVDMRIGLDIASLAYKRLVDRIVLISGDSDFVPAAKMARREGIEFVLDSMWAPIRPDLQEHIDVLYSCFPRPLVHKPQSSAESGQSSD